MNHTVIIDFVLLGLSDDPELQIVILLFLFITDVLSVTGNLTIITPNLGWTPISRHQCISFPNLLFLRNLLFWGQLLPKTRLFLTTIVQPNYFSLFSWG